MLEINFIVSDKYKLINRSKMIRLLSLCFLFSVILFSCSKDEDESNVLVEKEEIKPLLDFEIKVEGEAPKAKLIIENKSVGAKSYEWKFGEGVNAVSSVGGKPLEVEVDKAGNFEVKLIAEIDSKVKELIKTVDIKGYSAVMLYQDVMFGTPVLVPDRKFGRVFSFETGKVYEIGQFNTVTKSSLDILFRTFGSVSYHFEDTRAVDTGVENSVVIDNVVPESFFSAKMFDDSLSDKLLMNLDIVHSEERISDTNFPKIVVFKRKNGQKGVMKIKSIDSEKIIVDIKVQKY